MTQTLITALTALRRNVARSLLTMLGIVIGIAAVITMMEIGGGASEQIASSISNMGSNVIMVRSSAMQRGGVAAAAGSGITLTSADCDAIRENCPSVSAATPKVRGTSVQAIRGPYNCQPGRVDSGSVDVFDVGEWSVEDGAAFTERDVSASATVCVIGKTVAEALFPDGSSPVGERIRLNNTIFTVCGVLKPKGANLMGEDQNDMVIVPWTTMRNRLARSGGVASSGGGTASHSRGDRYAASSVSLYPARDATQTANYLMPIRFDNVDSIQCKAASAAEVDAAMEEIRALLRARHRIREGAEEDFDLHNMSEMLDALTSTSTLMTSLLLIVALISLVVGGVGIMNIMLVSVTERTREIGLRMAVGARGSSILVQFLVESLLLCIAGGVLGIAAGRVCSEIVSAVKGWPVAPSAAAIAMSVAVSATIGVAFGFYPAWRASRLNPIDALRYE
ncbi:MAG: ABC transporter permease [Kiritimatiellae bacterium]|nr:ABC transporter permease [Kiritimatiellia bacterium]